MSVIILASHRFEPKPQPPLPPIVIPKPKLLHVTGPLFATADGPYRLKLVTAFRAPERWAAGQDLRPFVDWTRRVGARGWRVFLQHAYLLSWPPDWPPQPWSMPIDLVFPFVEFCAEQGLYVELSVLQDCQAFEQDFNAQCARVQACYDTVAGCDNVLFQIGNEPSENGFDPVLIAKELGLKAGQSPLACLGSYPITGHEPVFPVLDFMGDHQPRKSDWFCECGKIGHYQYSQTGVPSFAEEPVKFSQPGADPEATEQSWDTSPGHAFDAGGGYALSSSGALFHCASGIATVVPGDLETVCARMQFQAMDWFPPYAPSLRYEHDGTGGMVLEPTTEACEVVARVGDTEAWVCCAGATAQWVPVPRQGWQIVQVGGAHGTLLQLVR